MNSTYLLIPLLSLLFHSRPRPDEPGSSLSVSGLKVENGLHPYIDRPSSLRFSWLLSSRAGNQMQYAYQVAVASSAAALDRGQGEIWNSGKIISDSSHLVSYKGPVLIAQTRYYWKVRVWDQQGISSSWSASDWFETGLLSQSGWTANWITAPDSLLATGMPPEESGRELGKWIWTTMPSSRNYFRKDFAIDETRKVRSVSIETQADNSFELFVNGRKVPVPHEKGWLTAPPVGITEWVHTGVNKIGIKAYGSDNPHWFLSALRAGIVVRYEDGTTASYPTDATWGAATQSNYYSNTETPTWLADPVGFPPGLQTVLHPRLLRHSLYLRKRFSISSKIVSARAYVTAKGLYEFHVNGRKAGDGLLTPGTASAYNYYQVYDIKDLLKPGTNAIGVITGNGWYNETGWHERTARKNELIAQIVITTEDGKQTTITTGQDWKVALSPILDNGFQGGERYDARQEIPGWDEADFDDASWTGSAAGSPWNKPPIVQPFEDVRVKMIAAPVSIREATAGTYLFDYGQNATGRCQLHLQNTSPGQMIVVRYGEKLRTDGLIDNGVYVDIMWPVDNEYDTSNAPFTCRNIDVYFCKGGKEEVFEPRFTYTGYQYIQVSGLREKPDPSTVLSRVFYTDLAETGVFHSSDTTLNKVWAAAQWSYRSNLMYGPLDCPTREKNFWSGDMACFAPTACLFMDNSRLLSAWTVDGSKIGADFPVRPPSPGWDDEIYITPYTLWRYYGDPAAIKGNYGKAKELVDYRTQHATEGLFTGGTNDPYNGDHAQPDGVPELPKDFDNAAFYYHSTDLLSQMAAIIGNAGDETKYRKNGVAIKAAFNRKFYSDANGYMPIMEATQIIPLAFGLTDTERRQKVTEALDQDIKTNKQYPGHLTTGFVSSPFLLPELTEGEKIATAWSLLMQDTYPSWKNMLKEGVNTITEEWAGIRTKKYNSMNHYVYGSAASWFFEYLAGIRNDEKVPGYKHIILRPYFPAGLDQLDCSYESPYGIIRSAWNRQHGRITWQITVPVNTKTTLYVPAAATDQILIDGKPVTRGKSGSSAIHTGEKEPRQIVELGSGSYVLSFNIACSVNAQSYPKLAGIDTMLSNEISANKIKNAVALVAVNGSIVYDKAFGNLENGKPVNTDAIYRIASQTKAITSVAIMMLCDQGKIKLDDPLSKYLPAFSNLRVLDKYKDGDTAYTTIPAAREITIKNLLQHTSGFDYPEIGGSFLAKLYNKSAIPAFSSSTAVLQDKVNELAKYPLLYQPGTVFNYSYSVDVLGAVVEKVSGISLDQFFHQYILDPLGMTDTYFYLPKDKYKRLIPMYVPDAAHHYHPWTKGSPGINMDFPLTKGTYFAGGGGLVSTVKDYFIFLQMLLNGGEYNGHRILKKETVTLMTTNQVGEMKLGYLGDNKWGLGFMVITEKGSKDAHLEKGSFTWAGAFGSYYWADPAKKLIGVLYINQTFLEEQVRTKFKDMVYAALNNN